MNAQLRIKNTGMTSSGAHTMGDAEKQSLKTNGVLVPATDKNIVETMTWTQLK